MVRIVASAVFAISFLALAPAQVSITVPDNVPSVGTCNVIPFGQSASFAPGYSYVGRVPASFLNAANTRLVEISFAPCFSGTWSAPSALVAIGHVPTPLPVPFTFPVGGLGSFIDLTVLWDSATQGGFSWTGTANSWSPLGFAAAGTTFCWNGVNDIGVYVTYQNATVTWDGSCHRTGTEPFRVYAAGYQAAVSSGSGASGLKMKLDFVGCGPPLYQVNSAASSLDIGGVQGTPYSAAITTAGIGTTVTVNFASTNAGVPFEVAVTLGSALVPVGGGAILTPFNQIVNVDITAPGLLFLNGGASPSFSTNFPGNFSATLGTGPVAFTLSGQMLNFDPVNPDGFVLSQGTQLNVQ